MFQKNKKLFKSKFQISVAKKSFPVFISYFFSILARQYSVSYLYDPSHTLIYIFFTGPVSSSAQPRIRPTDPISFGHLRPADASRHIRPPHRSSLYCPPPTLWSHLTSFPLPIRK
jgi:hypothetical protein